MKQNGYGHIVIYGAGANGAKWLKWLKYCHLAESIACFCDKRSYELESYEGIPVKNYEDVGNDDAVWLVTPENSNEIIITLQKDNRVFFLSFNDFILTFHSDNCIAMTLISEEKIIIDDHCDDLKKAYSRQNIKIRNTDDCNCGSFCYIFFSGNGLRTTVFC